MKNTILILLVVLVFVSCANKKVQHNYISPVQAIQLAAEAENTHFAIKGLFSLRVKAVGRQGKMFYLNSQDDYRDQRNLTIALRPEVSNLLMNKYNKTLKEIFIGKNIVVKGSAKRVKIYFFSQGRRTDKYYYQTHVLVTDINQIQLM